MNWRIVLSAALMSSVLISCVGVERHVQEIVTQDSSGVQIARIPGSMVSDAVEWSTGPRPVFSLGEPSPGEPSQFSNISGVRLLAGGRVMFASDASKQLFTVDATGATLESRGRPGNGPFEFQHLRMIASVDTTIITLFDALRQQVTLLPTAAFEPKMLSLAGLGIGASIPLVRFSDGHILAWRQGPLPAPSEEGVVAGVDSLVRVSEDGRLVTNFGGHLADDRVLRLTSSGGLTGGRPPFGRKLLAAADDSVVVVAAKGDWELWLYPPRGGLPRILRIDRPRRSVDAATRREYRERVLRDVRDEYGKREWTMLSNDDVFPREFPALDLILFDRDGDIWVRESAARGDNLAQWVVLERTGQPLARVRLPSSFTPFDITSDRIAGVWLDSLGGEQVQVWSLSRHRAPIARP